MRKKVVSFLLIVVMVLSMVPAIGSADDAPQTSFVVGNGVTIPNAQVPADGSNPYCNCGLSVGVGYHGCCWNYGRYVYYHIWGTYPNNRDTSSQYLRSVSAEDRTLTADHLKQYLKNAVPGALLRVDSSSSPTSGDNYGHTFIFVKMSSDGNGAYFLEGNYYGRGRSRLHEWDFDDLADVYDRYSYIKYISWPDAPDYTTQSATPELPPFAEKIYPSYCEITATSDTCIMSLPCSAETDAASTELASVAKDATLVAYQLVLDQFGSLWYKVKTADDQDGYVPSGKVSWTSAITDDIQITDETNPPDINIGDRYTIRGTISAQYSGLSSVAVYIYPGADTSGTPATGASDDIINNSYSLANSDVDMKTSFGSLSAGSYTYVVTAAYQNYYAEDEVTATSHTGTVTLQTSTFHVLGPVHTHEWQETSDTTHHWNYCSCGTTDGKSEHEFSAWAVTTPPSYTATGEEQQTCSVCDYTATRSIDKLTLDAPSVIISSEKACQPVTLTWTPVTDAQTYEIWCASGADGTYSQLATTSSTEFTDTTAKEWGSTYCYKVCAVIDSVKSAYSNVVSYVYAHTNIIVETGRAPACTTPGLTDGKRCDSCGTVIEEGIEIPANGHSEVLDAAISPTCTESGLSEGKHCSACGDIIVAQNSIPAKGHLFTSGTCTRCGVKDLDFKPVLIADANGDGKVNAKDAMLILRYDAELIEGTQLNLAAADVNGDGKVNAKDAKDILRFDAGLIDKFSAV